MTLRTLCPARHHLAIGLGEVEPRMSYLGEGPIDVFETRLRRGNRVQYQIFFGLVVNPMDARGE